MIFFVLSREKGKIKTKQVVFENIHCLHYSFYFSVFCFVFFVLFFVLEYLKQEIVYRCSTHQYISIDTVMCIRFVQYNLNCMQFAINKTKNAVQFVELLSATKLFVIIFSGPECPKPANRLTTEQGNMLRIIINNYNLKAIMFDYD